MLFSEPKIPQLAIAREAVAAGLGFSALQRAENSSICDCRCKRLHRQPFQCSSASRKFLNRRAPRQARGRVGFQCSSASRKFLNTDNADVSASAGRSFSALQRAENSSMALAVWGAARGTGFSALQRAENSSIQYGFEGTIPGLRFQCSSASRKFLNITAATEAAAAGVRFSALQRAENSSILLRLVHRNEFVRFSALQRAENSSMREGEVEATLGIEVSVLFSEPKIPQSSNSARKRWAFWSFSALQRAENSSIRYILRAIPPIDASFSALQRAENSSIRLTPQRRRLPRAFQCSSASRKFLNTLDRPAGVWYSMFQCSSASRKFLNLGLNVHVDLALKRFSALQRAENSSIPTLAPASIHIPDCDDHASSFLSLPGASP